MLMEVNGNYSTYTASYTEQLKAEPEEVKETENGQNSEKTSSKISGLHDEYISSEKADVRPSGLYWLGQDKDGRKKVFFDKPEKHTINTDSVDREIEKLKEQKQQLEQQIKIASGNEEKVKELEKKLSQVEGELKQKDNDTYRRQNAVVS